MTDTGTTIPEPPPAVAPPTGTPPADVPPAADTAGLYNVGETLAGRVVVSRTSETLWDKPETMCWLDGETEAQARPWSTIMGENDGKLIMAAEPTPMPMPKPGEIAAQVMKDLGWDDETSAKMAEARHAADPERYPTIESATYTDPQAAAPAAPAAPEPAATVPPVAPPVQ